MYEYIHRPSHPRPCSPYPNLNPPTCNRQTEKQTSKWLETDTKKFKQSRIALPNVSPPPIPSLTPLWSLAGSEQGLKGEMSHFQREIQAAFRI